MLRVYLAWKFAAADKTSDRPNGHNQGCTAKKRSVGTQPKTRRFQANEVWEREKRSVGTLS